MASKTVTRSISIGTRHLSVTTDVDLRETLYFLVSRQNIELKTSKHKFTDIIHQNKKGFKGKKLSGTEFNAFHGKIITSFLPRFSRFCLLVILQNPSKIICLTCIWLKFVDTSFHSSQKPQQITHKSCCIKSNRHTFKFLNKESLREAQNTMGAGTRYIIG